MKLTPHHLITALALSMATAHSAIVASLSGDYTPNANVIEAPNTITNAALFTTVVFSGTSWSVVRGPTRGDRAGA